MGNKGAVLKLLADRPVAYHPDLARIVGGVKAAVFLSQLLYWSGRGKRNDGYIWKTQDEWEQETGLTRYEQEGARKNLIERDMLEEKRMGWPAKMYYRIDFEALHEAIVAYYEGTDDIRDTECGKPTNSKHQNAENPQTIECGKPADFTESTRDYNTHVPKVHQARANFGMLARVCKIDLDTITPKLRGKLNQTERVLREKKGTTADDIKQFGLWWYKHWWQGEDGQAPRPMQVREEWGRFEDWRKGRNNEGVMQV